MNHAVFALIAVLLLAGCGGGTEAKANDEPKLDAATIEQTYTDALGKDIKDMCDPAMTHWACYYDGVEAATSSRLQVNLSTPGDVSEKQAKAMSKQARTHWFNFVGSDYPELDAITTMVNGRDTGTTQRSDVPLLNK